MKSLTRGHLKAGIDSVRGAKLRNFWTMLGVIIGVASVISVVGIGEGVKQQISGHIHHIGANVITIRPSALDVGGSGVNAGTLNLLSGISITGTLSNKDLSTVSGAPGVATAVPLSAMTDTVRGNGGSYKSGLVIGTTAGLPSILNQSMEYGVFLPNDNPNANSVVIGSQAAVALFSEDVPLGQELTINGQQFIVSGVFNDFPATPLSGEANFNKAVFIPYDAAESMSKGTAVTYEILARSKGSNQTNAVAQAIRKQLQNAHGGQMNFSVAAGNQNLTSSDQILDLLTRLIAGIAAISLLVGGIGIMNVMLVSVTERMHEIGIRKAVGATNRQILSQFMIEATMLSLVGGIVGIVLAFLIDLGLRLFTNLQPVIGWQIVVLATGVSLIVGIVFGSIPALKAARKAPIDALRSE